MEHLRAHFLRFRRKFPGVGADCAHIHVESVAVVSSQYLKQLGFDTARVQPIDHVGNTYAWRRRRSACVTGVHGHAYRPETPMDRSNKESRRALGLFARKKASRPETSILVIPRLSG
jgi:hypothetical protein